VQQLIELKTRLTVWTLEEPEYYPCPELLDICDAIDAPRLTRSPAELYPTRNPICTQATDGSTRFLCIDTTGPEDGMEFVTVCIRCYTDDKQRIASLLHQLRERSEIVGPLLDGQLGIACPPHNPNGG
jgi:hypothetical protein